MFSSQVDEVSATPTTLLDSSVSGHGIAQVPIDERRVLSPDQVRIVVRLFQCPQCSLPLLEPVTLPCGKTLCRRCLPEPHVRTHISYPATANRLQAFRCPFLDCTKEHAVGDCTPNVILNKVLTAWKTLYEEARNAALTTELVTDVTTRNQWETAGVPTLQAEDTAPQSFPGGRLMATYLMADNGALEYGDEVAYTTPESTEHAVLDAKVLADVKEVTRAEVDCQVCYALFYDGLTTPCGHTFCRSCLQRVLDHTSHCPICRRELTMQPVHNGAPSPANELLKDITTAFWSDILEVRRQAIIQEGLTSSNDDEEFDLALFICTLSFPLMPTFLHIFEPRYRLMIRRALERDRTFGMVLYEGHGFVELGTTLRIVNAEFFADGRSLIETVGVSRFRILRHGVVDGYVAAKIERINDISLAEEEELEVLETTIEAEVSESVQNSPTAVVGRTSSNEQSESSAAEDTTPKVHFPRTRREIETLPTQALMNFATDFVSRMREQSVAWLTARILAIYGECPDDPALFPWWFANILPVRETEKYRLLGTTSVRERLKICCGWILEWEASRWSLLDCVVS